MITADFTLLILTGGYNRRTNGMFGGLNGISSTRSHIFYLLALQKANFSPQCFRRPNQLFQRTGPAQAFNRGVNGTSSRAFRQRRPTKLQHLESISIRIVFRVDGNGIIPIDLSPAFNAGDDRRLAGYSDGLLYPAGEFGTDNALMDKGIPFL